MKRFTTYFSHYFVLFLSAFFLFSACSNPADSDEEEHHDPFGIALFENGVEIATFENGELTYSDGDHLELQVGEETGLISVRFISEEGERFTPDENDGYSLQWEIGNESVLEVEQHEEDGAWEFHLVGAGSGETNIEFILFHNDHEDFRSPIPFEVHVEEAVTSLEIQNEDEYEDIDIYESSAFDHTV